MNHSSGKTKYCAIQNSEESSEDAIRALMEIYPEAEAAMALGLFDAAEEGYAKAIPICARLLGIQESALSEMERRSVSEMLSDMRRHWATILHFQYGDSARAAALLENCADGESRALFGVCCYRLNRTEEAFAALLNAYEDEYLAANAADWKQLAFAEGMLNLSEMFRSGDAPDGRENCEKAIEILKKTLRTITDEDAIHLVLGELNRYQKCAGGYLYVRNA